ncbi:MAG: hypothetical protein COX57_07965 [Alphaproteobacteria bacterium CG_4_10_14_0_2_um_filter_63_37]|nr:MAG: hypothetical protein AUJ55_03735 [Proteobacteria bacterium CG1_02_64_396]PJA24555.1 MAG: hypothetical protein COX57_07965 [Alphaproteobacteria bacterium CG_4_10_14_0_2_um_filter_63_37]
MGEVGARFLSAHGGGPSQADCKAAKGEAEVLPPPCQRGGRSLSDVRPSYCVGGESVYFPALFRHIVTTVILKRAKKRPRLPIRLATDAQARQAPRSLSDLRSSYCAGG